VLVSDKKSALYLKSYFKQIGIQEIVICPGSRNLPLIVNFSNDDYFKVYSILDERIAGFFALGIVKAKKKPVVVITTSGSAAINLAPAMAEAYYQRLPLIAITADRPSNYINKGENQTIVQTGLYSNYVGFELEIDEKINFESFQKKIQSFHQYLMNTAGQTNVHLNLPFSEPLDKVENVIGEFQFKLNPDIVKRRSLNSNGFEFKEGQNVIIYVSTQTHRLELNKILDKGVAEKNWVVISEMHSGWNHEKTISQIDLILARNIEIQDPDVLITIGETMLSKRFRNYAKSLESLIHIDLSPYSRQWDILSENYKNIQLDYNNLEDKLNFSNSSEFLSFWQSAESQACEYLANYHSDKQYTEFRLIQNLVESVPEKSFLYWGNSSAVRYGNWSQWKNKPHLTHLTNRGVSGIEGVLSTAIGYQLFSQSEQFYCILGDLSLLYEQNSLSILPYIENMKIIVINNYGGRIFEQIHNSRNLGHTNTLITPHCTSFDKIAKIHDLEYFRSIGLKSFLSQWELVKSSKSKLIFEICIEKNEVDSWKEYFS
jgi:2-succinyl-5-enolpyruvyl-6-hydroxy-3-cyclohexene-1-carboxylate synthase